MQVVGGRGVVVVVVMMLVVMMMMMTMMMMMMMMTMMIMMVMMMMVVAVRIFSTIAESIMIRSFAITNFISFTIIIIITLNLLSEAVPWRVPKCLTHLHSTIPPFTSHSPWMGLVPAPLTL